jgi:hypothetical protein
VVESPRGDLSAVEVDGAATAIEEWLTGVRQALRAVEALPSSPLAWIDVVDEPGGNEKRVIVSKPLVQLYADSHVVRRLKSLHKALAIESLSVQDDERTERLRTLFAAISDYWSKRLTRRIRAQVTKFIAPYIVFIVGPAVILGGIDAEDVRAAFVLAVLLLSLPVYVVAARVATVPLGFIPRRALWSGGVTVLSIDRKGHRKVRCWKGFPRTDLYRAEAAMFDALRVPMAPERPLDISVALDVVFGLMIAGGVAVVVAMAWSGAAVGWIVVVALIVVGFATFVAIDSGSRLRMRRARKEESQRVEPAGGGPAAATP